MGPQQLAGVLSIVARDAAAASGKEFDEAKNAERTAAIETQSRCESHAFFMSARSTTTGSSTPSTPAHRPEASSLSAAHNNPVEGRRGFGVFRM